MKNGSTSLSFHVNHQVCIPVSYKIHLTQNKFVFSKIHLPQNNFCIYKYIFHKIDQFLHITSSTKCTNFYKPIIHKPYLLQPHLPQPKYPKQVLDTSSQKMNKLVGYIIHKSWPASFYAINNYYVAVSPLPTTCFS